ncbi:hypothetical protein C8F04DRAFT_1256405 [Mycena alexandri]|uniref:Uncharacterized protein n=1 Tax=Mycena alexandri TaxID=1745969 RepID=A0AAD6T1X8_9AGAR|nr:hypothetical protein C8F04DRAFT_1256405 [Mycena alexandri]
MSLSVNPPSAVAPSYSPEPGNDEQTPLTKYRAFSGNRTRKSGRDNVILTGQDEQANVPTYGPSALIGGSVSLEDGESVSKVALEIKGTIEFMAADSMVTQTIFAEHSILWSMEHSAGAASPSTVPFLAHLPAQFEYNKATYPLPPSYSVSADGGVYAKIVYSLAVTVSRARGRKLAFLSPNSKNTCVAITTSFPTHQLKLILLFSISIPFAYSPRTRAIAPFPSNPKITLGQRQFDELTLTARPRPRVLLPPVDVQVCYPPLFPSPPAHTDAARLAAVQLLTPTADVFPLGTPIPVHVHLTGPPASLSEFLPTAGGAPPRSRVAVRLLRQTTMLVDGHKETCQTTLWTAALVAASGAQDAWDGELRADADAGVLVGSFDAGVLGVQDFIVLDVLDPAGPKSQFARFASSPTPMSSARILPTNQSQWNARR